MEYTELNVICDFEAGVNCLQNPSLISRFLPLSGIALPQVYKWGALILALLATLSGIIARTKLLFYRFCQFKFWLSSGSSIQLLNDEDIYDDDDDDDSCSSASSDEEEYQLTTPFQNRQPADEDYSIAGSSFDLGLRRRPSFVRRFSWSDFAVGKSVVKLWDNLSLGLDSDEESSRSVVSIWDINGDKTMTTFSDEKCQNPTMMFSAKSTENGNVLLGLYDERVGRQAPAILADWPLRRRTVVGVNPGGVKKVCVRDDVTGALTVGDMRNVKTPLEIPTESDVDTWWDADAVIVSDECVGDYR